MTNERADRIFSKLNERQIVALETMHTRLNNHREDDEKIGAKRHGSLTKELQVTIATYLAGIESCDVITERERAWLYIYYTL